MGGRTPFCVQTASQRILQKKNSAYAKNINKRGEVPSSLVVDEEKRAKCMMALSPFAVGFLCFVVIGSSVVAFLSSLLGGAEARRLNTRIRSRELNVLEFSALGPR